MNKRTILSTAISLIFICCLSSAAQDGGYWRAASTTAKAITGDIAFSNTKLVINFLAFPLAPIRDLKPAELSAAFDADLNAGGSGTLYRMNIPAIRRFLHRNTLCGSEDTQWMATYISGRTLHVTFFSGSDMPVLTLDALANSSEVCGTFSYSR